MQLMQTVKEHPKAIGITAGSIALAGVATAIALAVWNSNQMKLYRLSRKTGKILYRLGSVLQTVSGVMD